MAKPLEMRGRISGKMRLFLALVLLATALCVTSKKLIHGELAPTNCKLVFNLTSFQMDCERGDGDGDGHDASSEDVSELKPNH